MFRLIVRAYHDESEIIYQSSFIWSEAQAEDLLEMFRVLHGDTYNMFVEEQRK